MSQTPRDGAWGHGASAVAPVPDALVAGVATDVATDGATDVGAGAARALGLSSILAVLPADATLPVWWLREKLALADGATPADAMGCVSGQALGNGPEGGAHPRSSSLPPLDATARAAAPSRASVGPLDTAQEAHEAWLTVKEYGARRMPRRSADWVRSACHAGQIPGAIRTGREWLIPASLLAVEAEARRGALAGDAMPRATVPGGAADKRSHAPTYRQGSALPSHATTTAHRRGRAPAAPRWHPRPTAETA